MREGYPKKVVALLSASYIDAKASQSSAMFGPKKGPPAPVPPQRRGAPPRKKKPSREEEEALRQQKYLDELGESGGRFAKKKMKKRFAVETRGCECDVLESAMSAGPATRYRGGVTHARTTRVRSCRGGLGRRFTTPCYMRQRTTNGTFFSKSFHFLFLTQTHRSASALSLHTHTHTATPQQRKRWTATRSSWSARSKRWCAWSRSAGSTTRRGCPLRWWGCTS